MSSDQAKIGKPEKTALVAIAVNLVLTIIKFILAFFTGSLALLAEAFHPFADMRLSKAAKTVRGGAEETLRYMNFPREYCFRIRTNNPLERIMREIRRRTRVVGCFPDGKSALMLVAARLRHIQSTRWGSRVYLNMKLMKETEEAMAV